MFSLISSTESKISWTKVSKSIISSLVGLFKSSLNISETFFNLVGPSSFSLGRSPGSLLSPVVDISLSLSKKLSISIIGVLGTIISPIIAIRRCLNHSAASGDLNTGKTNKPPNTTIAITPNLPTFLRAAPINPTIPYTKINEK